MSADDKPVVIDTPAGIAFAQLVARTAALRLEIKGFRHSSGRSIYTVCKREYGLKGSRQRVLTQLEGMIQKAHALRGCHR